ncbi:hypothetical protein [Pseudoneobacillus sp. C159]
MDDRLNQLKESMDDTVLKNLDFRAKNKAEVRMSIHRPKKSNRFTMLIPRMLSIGFTSLLLFGIGYFALENSGLLSQEETQQPNMADQKEPNLSTKNDRVYTPPSQAENQLEMTKEEVLNLLLNSVDYFETVSGKFETYDVYYDRSTSGSIIEYTISNKGIIGGYEKLTSIPDEKVPGAKAQSLEMFYNDQVVWRLENNTKSFTAMEYESETKRGQVKPNDVFSIRISKIYDSPNHFRERPPVGSAHSSLFPYEFTAKYLRFTDDWIIENQNEELLGHNTVVLSGSIDKSLVNMMQPEEQHFRLWIDKDTGILLKKEVYKADGEIVSYLHPERLEVNIPVDSTLFIPDLADYQERIIEGPSYEDPREAEIEVVEHADLVKDAVEEVVTILRDQVPFLYEFSHTDLQPYSASLEKYHEFTQAYLTYSFKKPPQERGSGSQLLYVRMYHKDSVVRSFTDFDTEKGEELGNFTVNGINWKAFEIKSNPNTHFIGTHGDYIYEVVTQEVSFDEAKNLLNSFNRSTTRP